MQNKKARSCSLLHPNCPLTEKCTQSHTQPRWSLPQDSQVCAFVLSPPHCLPAPLNRSGSFRLLSLASTWEMKADKIWYLLLKISVESRQDILGLARPRRRNAVCCFSATKLQTTHPPPWLCSQAGDGKPSTTLRPGCSPACLVPWGSWHLCFSFVWQEIPLGPDDVNYVLEGLSRGTKYIIHIVAFKGDRWSKKASISFSTGKPWKLQEDFHITQNVVCPLICMLQWEFLPSEE